MKLKYIGSNLLLLLLLAGCASEKTQPTDWQLIPFTKNQGKNICLVPLPDTKFFCPIRQTFVYWEAKDVFNPATVVRNDTLFMIYRAEDEIGKYAGTSRLGLAFSTDGSNFIRHAEPVVYPNNDEYKNYEWEGGIEDPRIVENEDGVYYLTYTAYNGDKARLFVATSTDLRSWTKHGSIFKKYNNGELVNIWSKAGSVVCRKEGERLIATKINGKYWMFWGESNIYMATSENLIDWSPIEETDTTKTAYDFIRNHRMFKTLFTPRQGMFDSGLVEPGPPAIITPKGILFIYNSRNSDNPRMTPDSTYEPGEYTSAQILLDKDDPSVVLERAHEPFLKPDQQSEINGQVGNVCFAEGLSFYKGKWFLYYGTADSKIGVAQCDKLIH